MKRIDHPLAVSEEMLADASRIQEFIAERLAASDPWPEVSDAMRELMLRCDRLTAELERLTDELSAARGGLEGESDDAE